MKPGIKSTEFWLVLVALAAGVVLIVLGRAEIGEEIIKYAVPGYALARGYAKGRNGS